MEGPKNAGLVKIYQKEQNLMVVIRAWKSLTIDFSKDFVANSKGDSLQKSNIVWNLL